MASPATVLKIEAKVGGLEQVEGLKSAVRSLQNTAPPAAENINKLRDAAKSLGNAAEASTSDLRTSATVLKFLKDQVALTSKEYRDLSNDLKTVENRFNAANTAAKQFRSSAGPLSGGTAGAGIMGRPTEKLDPYMRLGFGTNDPEYWRKRQETHPGGAAIFPQQLDYAATNKALSSMQSANDQMTAVANKGRQDRLLVQEKYNQLEIAQQDAAHKKQLLNQQRMDDIEGRFFEMRLNNAASIREKAQQRIAQRRQQLVTAGQTVGAVAASGVFGGPEGALGAIIGAAGGPGGALVGGAIGAQVGMLRQSIGDTATYASEITRLNIALKGITKTSQEYADAQRAISSISNTLNVPIKEATAGFTKLSASVIGAGGNVNDAQIVMLGFTQAIKATGGGAEEVSGVMTALTQIFSKGKISAEEINQIAERLPGAFTAIAKAAGKTGPELQDALKNGEVGLNDLMKTAQYLTDQYGVSANRMAQSSEESGARMTVALDEVKLAIGSAFQPIGSMFQDSITEMVASTKESLKTLKEAISAVSKVIEDLVGPQTLKAIKDFADANSDITKELKEGFKGLPFVIAASIDPLARTFALLVKIAEVAKIIKLFKPEPEALGDGRYAAPAQQQKIPTEFQLAKSEGDDAAKKEAKLKQQIELQRELNNIESQFNAYELPRLKGLQEIQLRLAALGKDANVEAKKKLELTANELQYQIDALKISKQLNIELAKNKTIEDARLKEVQRQGIDQKMQDELKKLNLTRDTKRKAIEQGVTLELKKQTEELKKQADEYQEILRSVQQSLDQPLVVLGQNLEEEKLKLRYRRDPRALEAELQDLGIRRQFAEAQKEGLAKIKPEDRSEFLAALEVSKQKALETAEAIRALKRSIDELNAADVGQGFKNGVESFLTSIGTMSENVSQLTQNAFQGLSDGIAELVTTGKMNFNDFANSIIKDMIRIATQQLILRPILQGIGGLFGGGGGLSGGGYFDSITGLGKAGPNFGLAKGGVITQNGIQAFARGGIVDKPMLFPFAKGIGLMGEAGPEAIMPLRRGRDGNLGVAGGGGTTNVVVNVDAGGTKAQGDAPRGEQLGKALSAAVHAELIKQRRPGGLLA
jgi:lambda family phage tail tape measure protein